MAQLVIAAAGAAIGGMVAPGVVALGLTGSSIGWIAGSMLGATFAPNQKSEGPRLGDLNVGGSAYGSPIPYVLGTPRVAGQIIWASAKREIATTSHQGKGGGGGADYTSYTYEVDVLYEVSDNEIAGVRRIWSNGKLVWSAADDATSDTHAASALAGLWSRMTVYTGASDQMPDATYEADVGAGNAPAYRGRGTVMVEGLQLGNSGQLPNLTFELVAAGTLSSTRVVQSDWLLCHFDEYTTAGTEVLSAMGPDLIRPLTNPQDAVLRLASAKFGAQGGYFPTSSDTFQAYGVTGDLAGRSWRAEGFFRPSADGQGFFDMQRDGDTVGGGFAPQINIAYAGLLNDAFYYILRDGTTFSSGAIGSMLAPFHPTIGIWNHIAVQFNALTGETAIFSNGVRFAVIITDMGSWAGLNFGAVNFSGAECDEFYFRPIADEDCYDVVYSVPGTAFVPAAGTEINIDTASITVTSTTIAQAVTALSGRAGLSAGQIDVTALSTITTPVHALAVSQVASARSVIEMLMSTYFFDAVLADKVYFRPRGGSSVATLAFDELGTVPAGDTSTDPLLLSQANELEIPAQIALTYTNIDTDYQTDTQYSDRLLTGMDSTSAITVPCGFTATEAKAIVDAMLQSGAASALSTTLALGLEYSKLEAGDVVTVTGEDASTYRLRLTKKTDAAGVLTFAAVADDASVLLQDGTTSDATPGQTVVRATPATSLEVLDIPLLRDVDDMPGHYVAITGNGAGWANAGLFYSADDLAYSLQTTLADQAPLGVTSTTLGTWAGGDVFDEGNTVTVTTGQQELASLTRDEILASQAANAALVGDEVIQYRDATLVSAGVYKLSGLLRGRRGTGWAVGTHATGERFVGLSTSGVRFMALDSSELGRERFYKAASAGQRLSTVTAESLTPAGINQKPFAPVDLRANRDAADTVLTWIRRTRLSTRIGGTVTQSIPLGETSEAYEVEVWTSGFSVLKRTISASTPTCTYTSAQQTTDFGGAQTTLYLRVYQISAEVGRGYVLQATV